MIVAGERSGDVYGAELVSALRARLDNLEVFGCGGESMRRAGVDTVVDAHQVTMIGIAEVVGGLPRAYRAFHALLHEVDKRRPQLAVLIDFPDFNLRLAKQLKKRGIRVDLLRKSAGLGVAEKPAKAAQGSYRQNALYF